MNLNHLKVRLAAWAVFVLLIYSAYHWKDICDYQWDKPQGPAVDANWDHLIVRSLSTTDVFP